MCTHRTRISVALSAAVVLGAATLTPSPARALPNNAAPQRIIVVYKPVPTIVYKAVPTKSTTSSKSGSTNAGSSSSDPIGDVLKQAAGDFVKSAIDGFLKLPSK